MRVLIIGLDGATFDIIEPLASQGRLPNLATLLERGSHGDLKSTVPPITPVAWTSFMTGKRPEKHGIFDFDQVQFDYMTFPVPANQHNHKSLWRIASEAGKRVVGLDIPFTYPPEEVNGVLTCGFGTPMGTESSFCTPPHFADEMQSRFGSFPVAVPDTPTRANLKLFAAWDRIMENRAQVVPYVHQNYDWDLFMVVFGVTDNILHALWTYLEPQHPDFHTPEAPSLREKVALYYARVDQIIGELLEATDSETRIFVVSDHGFGTTAKRDFLPQFLIDNGFLHYKGNARLSTLGGFAMKQFLRVYNASSPLKFLLRGMSQSRKTTVKNVLTQTIDWSRTCVFTGSQRLQLLLYVNRAGKFKQGIHMTDAECHELLARLKELLLDLRDPTLGMPILSKVYETGHACDAQHRVIVPDLMLEYANFYDRDRLDVETTSCRLEGNHVPEGILIAQGPGIARGKVRPFELVDVAPTVLYSLGLPIPSDLDGRVMESLFAGSVLQQAPVLYSRAPAIVSSNRESGYSETEAEQVRKHLRNLGYL
jgi:predicted AlkP superfamily phosphohydrolase/phosphomutase